MNNFIETVNDLSDYLKECDIDYQGQNFEDLYSSLYEGSEYDGIRQNCEKLIYDYFAGMQLPEEPTLYDHLVLSLTGRDAIATFNWDPFLWQALCRNCHRVGKDNLPQPIYLHGNTAIGVCTNHEKIRIGHKGDICPRCGKRLERSKLLYPIKRKKYNADPFIKSSWDVVKMCLEDSFMFTVFGYSAPSSDVEAVRLLQEGWGDREQRRMEQIEVIDIIGEDVLSERWDSFILSHHYGTHNDFYSSLIAKCSRRSVDACFNAVVNIIYWQEHPIPKEASWDELNEWVKPYLEFEEKAKQSA